MKQTIAQSIYMSSSKPTSKYLRVVCALCCVECVCFVFILVRHSFGGLLSFVRAIFPPSSCDLLFRAESTQYRPNVTVKSKLNAVYLACMWMVFEIVKEASHINFNNYNSKKKLPANAGAHVHSQNSLFLHLHECR